MSKCLWVFFFVMWLNSGELRGEDIYNKDAVVLLRDGTGKVLGIGFVVKPTGLILTSFGVVSSVSEPVVEFEDGNRTVGNVTRIDRRSNLALVKIKGENLPFLELGDSGTVRNIDKAIVVGYGNIFEGRICGIEKAEDLKWIRFTGMVDPFNFLILFKIDVEIPNLYKGSPLLNAKCQVIGVNVLIHKDKKDYLYAVAINEVFKVFCDEFTDEQVFEVKKGKFEKMIRGVRYAMYVPKGYSHKLKWPLILAFHPAGDGGEIRNFWIEEAERSGFIVAGPYTFQGDIWNTYDDYRIFQMLKDILRNYNIDRERIYLTGLSGGAVFSYYLGITYPEYFSAVAGVTSGSILCIKDELDLRKGGRRIPILMIHGTDDTVVPACCIRNDVDRLRNYGYKVSYQEIKGMGHEHKPFINKIYPQIIEFFNRYKR